MTRPPRNLGGFVVFGGIAAAVALLIAIVGQGLAVERFGGAAARAWWLGCLVTLVGSWMAGLAVTFGKDRTTQGVVVALASMLVRLVVVAVAGSAAVILLALGVKPFLLAVAVSYLALLVVDTAWALRAAGVTER